MSMLYTSYTFYRLKCRIIKVFLLFLHKKNKNTAQRFISLNGAETIRLSVIQFLAKPAQSQALFQKKIQVMDHLAPYLMFLLQSFCAYPIYLSGFCQPLSRQQ